MTSIKELGEKGFSIVELVIATAVAAIVSAVMLSLSLYFYGDVLQAQATTEMAMESQLILTQLVEDIKLSDGIGSSNEIPDANQPGGWTTNDPSNILIIKSPAIDNNRDIIYDSETGYPYRNELIYFTNGTSMYRRSLKNTDAPGNTSVTTCPTASPGCPDDKKYTDHIANLTFSFYDSNNSPTSNASQARSVDLTVNMSRRIYGQTITLSNSTRTTLRNY